MHTNRRNFIKLSGLGTALIMAPYLGNAADLLTATERRDAEPFEAIKEASIALLMEYARKSERHYGASGSMDADLKEFPHAEGPSYYNQFAHYGYLLLSEGIVPGASPDEKVRFQEIALRNISYLLNITDADFRTPHYSTGVDWGKHRGDWNNYYLLSSLQILEARQMGTAELRARLSETVRGAVGKLIEEFRKIFPIKNSSRREFPGNHSVWYFLLFYAVGLYFKNKDWTGYARDLFGIYVLPFQNASGEWAEGKGIVVNYSMVTAQAVSIYAELCNDKPALDSMGPAITFFKTLSFPDGTGSIVADVRMRYSKNPFVFLPPSFLRSSEGRSLCLERITNLRGKISEDNPGAQSFAFFANFVHFLFDSARPSIAGTLPAPAITGLPVARIEDDTWTAFVSWQLIPETKSRWILDAQNFIECWHRDSGYLVGKGNSKYMPRFSTIRKTSNGRNYIPDRIELLEKSETHVACVYHFDEDQIRMVMTVAGGKLHISFAIISKSTTDTYEAGLLLAFSTGDELLLEGKPQPVTVSGNKSIAVGFDAERRSFSWLKRNFTLPKGSLLEYPVIPHYPYNQTSLPLEKEYVARISIPVLKEEQEVMID